MTGIALGVTVLWWSAVAVDAQEKEKPTEKVAIEKVVRAYLEHQASPGKREKILEWCVAGATHAIYYLDDRTANPDIFAIRDLVKHWEEKVKQEDPIHVDSVRVQPYGEKSNFAVAFVEFRTSQAKVRDVFTLTRVEDAWKVVSVVQQNRLAQ